MSHQPSWQSIIRFKDVEDQIHYGEPSADFSSAVVWTGTDIMILTKTDIELPVKELLAPYSPTNIIGIGLNYREHAKEGGMNLPRYPVVFHKTPNAISGPHSTIFLHSQAANVDYENELCFITSAPAKDILAADAHNYILGYTVGNDVSARAWQMPDMSGGQYSFAKSFDGFCPIGPRIVSSQAIADPQKLRITTKRSGRVVQDSTTADMLFGVPELLAFLSQGTTVPAGTLVMTGTPPGVAMFEKVPPIFLAHGEVVECEIEGIGALINEFRNPEL